MICGEDSSNCMYINALYKFPIHMYMYIEFCKLKVCVVFGKSAVQATGNAALTHA